MAVGPVDTSPRGRVRSSRSRVFRRLTKVGGRLDEERQRQDANQRTLAIAATKLINDLAPRPNREKIRVETPMGVFDGANTSFTLSVPVTGQNIIVIWGDTSVPRTIPLTRGNSNPPANEAFFFDPNFPTAIVVGNPPQAADALLAVFDIE